MFFKKLPLKKIIAVFSCAAFMLSAVSANSFSMSAYADVKKITLTADDLILPFNLGRVTDSVDYSTAKVIVQVRDLHAHPQTQKNIASILSILDKEYGIAGVYVEGAPKGKLSTKWLAEVPDAGMRDALTEIMMSGGELSGAEYYSILSGRTELLKGIEDIDVYIDNFLRLGGIEKNKGFVSRQILLMQEKIERLGKKNYSPDNKKILSLTQKYKNNKITSEQYFKALLKNAKKHGITLTKYPQIVFFGQMASLKKEIKNNAVQKEKNKFLKHLQETLSYSEYKKIIELSQSAEEEGVFYLKLAQFLQDGGNNGDYPGLRKFFDFIRLNQKVNPVELVRQEELLVNEIRNKAAKSPAEREILFMERFAHILGALLQNKITFGEYKNYNYSFENFKRTLNKYIIFNELGALESAVKTAGEFYDVNTVRDGYFVEALEGVPVKPSDSISTFESSQLNNAAGMLKNAKKIDVIITGGFHTDGVSKLLESKRQSYIVITPCITQDVAGSEKVYGSMVKRQTAMFSRNAFDAVKKSAVFEISPAVIDPAKAAFSVLFSEETIRKLYEDGILEIKMLESMINKGYGREAVKITDIKVSPDAVYAEVNGKNIIITNNGVMYEDETSAVSQDIEISGKKTLEAEAPEDFAIQNAVIDLLILSLKKNVSIQEIDNVFDALNARFLPQEVINALKETAKKFPSGQKEYLEAKISQKEAFGGEPVLTAYPAVIEKMSFKALRAALKFAYSSFIAPFAETGEIIAIAAHLNISGREVKEIMSEAKRLAENDAEIEIARSGETVSAQARAAITKSKIEEALNQAVRKIIETRLQKKLPRIDFLLAHSGFKGENKSVMADALDKILVSAARFSKVKPLMWMSVIAGHMAHNIKAQITRSGSSLSKDIEPSDVSGSGISVYELMKANGLGAIYDGKGTHFGVYSKNAEKMELCLFDDDGKETRVAMTKDASADVWNVYMPEIKPGQKYGFRAHGPYDPGNGHFFNPNKLAVDPYSFQQEARFIFDDALRVCEKGNVYKMDTRDSAPFVPKSVVFDLRKLDGFQTAQPPAFPSDKSRIYELHVGGFTALKEDLPQNERGTLKGLASQDIIEHFKRIGINTVEVQPIQSDANDPYSHERGLRNNSGYQSVTFFALNPEFGDPARPYEDLLALKEAIGKLSAAGIKFGMDVVDNHSGEGSADMDPSLCYRLLDNATYYLANPNDKSGYDDASGCGNAFNTNNPVVVNMMTKYKEMYALLGVRLFRHDLMAAAARNEHTGEFDPDLEYMRIFKNSAILSEINEKEGILVAAEGYMATGGVRGVNSYYTDDFHKDISTWSSGTREAIRDFIMGRGGPGALAAAIADPNTQGSPRQPHVYYMGSHDGHPYAQLMAVREKDNSDNGWNNSDGPNEYGMGLGYDNERIPMYVASAMTVLSFFQGPVMFGMGDEFLRTQHGNNNPYNQSNQYLNMRWDKEAPLAKYMSALAKYRTEHLSLDASLGDAFSGRIVNDAGDRDITWLHPEGREAFPQDWQSSHFGFMVSGDRLNQLGIYDDDTLVLMNMSDRPVDWNLPLSAGKGPWHVYCSAIDLELSNHGDEVYWNRYLVMPGEAVILYKPRSIGGLKKMIFSGKEKEFSGYNIAMTSTYPEFIENIKTAPLRSALRCIYSVFGAPAAEMNEMMLMVSGKISQKDFLEKHKEYAYGNKIAATAMEKGLAFIIRATLAAGGRTWLGKTVNYTLHMMYNIIAAVISVFISSKTAAGRINAKIRAKKLSGVPYIINADIYDSGIRQRAEQLTDAGIRVIVIATSADKELAGEEPSRDDSFGFPAAKIKLNSKADIYFPDIIGNARSSDIFDALSHGGERRVILEERVKKGEKGFIPVRYAVNIIAAEPGNSVSENIESALQSAKTEYRVNAVKKWPVNMDYIFADELTDSDTIKNRVAESADKNFDAVVVPSGTDTEILKLLISESYGKNIKVMFVHEFTNGNTADELSDLRAKLYASRIWFDANDFAGAEGVILRFGKVDASNAAEVRRVENAAKAVQTALNGITRSGYIGVELGEGNKITDFKFKGMDIINITLSGINDKRTYPENAAVLFYLDKNSISPESISPSDIADIMKRFEKAQTVILPGWLIDFTENSNAGFNPAEFLRARLGIKKNIAATFGEALNKGRIDAIGKGYYLEGGDVNAFCKTLLAIRKGETAEASFLESALNTTVYYKSLSGRVIRARLAQTSIVKGELAQALVNYSGGEQGSIALRQFEGIMQGILETTEFKRHVKKKYSNRDDFENHSLALVEARLACLAGGIEITEDDITGKVPYLKALEKLSGRKIDGFSYDKNGESDLPVREHMNILFGAVNDPETEPLNRALALADLLQMFAIDASEIKITEMFTNRTEIRNINAILASA